jgi:hypothetical protein
MLRDRGQESARTLSRRSLFGSISLVLVVRATTVDSDNVETLSEIEGESCVYVGAVKEGSVQSEC